MERIPLEQRRVVDIQDSLNSIVEPSRNLQATILYKEFSTCGRGAASSSLPGGRIQWSNCAQLSRHVRRWFGARLGAPCLILKSSRVPAPLDIRDSTSDYDTPQDIDRLIAKFRAEVDRPFEQLNSRSPGGRPGFDGRFTGGKPVPLQAAVMRRLSTDSSQQIRLRDAEPKPRALH
jgi:hypothetical protein